MKQIAGFDDGRDFEFDKSLVRIGRMPDSDVAFDAENDLDASGRHAEIRSEVGRYLLIDTGSRNGTWINGERVKHAMLKEGDEIEFGPGGPRLEVIEIVTSTSEKPSKARFASGKITIFETDAQDDHDRLDSEVSTIIARPLDPPPSGIAASDSEQPRDETEQDGTSSNPRPAVTLRPEIDFDRVAAKLKRVKKRRSVDKLKRFLPFIVLTLIAAALFASRANRTEPQVEVTVDVEKLQRQVPAAIGWVTSEKDEADRLCATFTVKANTRSSLVATTASCVMAIRDGQDNGQEYMLRVAGGDTKTIQKMWKHPAYDHGLTSPDLGLIEVSGPLSHVLILTDGATLASIEAGQAAIVWSDENVQTGYSRIELIDSLDKADETGHSCIRIDQAAFPGSPIFDGRGNLIALFATYGGKSGSAADGFGVRIDLLRALVEGL